MDTNKSDAFTSTVASIQTDAEMIEMVIKDYDLLIGQVFNKIKLVQNIANKTNLLAINASIETIHASELLASFEQIVTDNLFIQAKILSVILEHHPDILFQDGAEFAKKLRMEEVHMTDGNGIILFSSEGALIGTPLKSPRILKILEDETLAIQLTATESGLDNRYLKTVGIARRDQPGIIQISTHFQKPQGQSAINGFGVVAQEAKRLADISKEISTRITDLTDTTGDKIGEINTSASALFKEIQEGLVDSIKLRTHELSILLSDTRTHLKEIEGPLNDLINIARQTNLLGVRAAIEASHSTNDKQDFDNLLNTHMTIQAKLAAMFVEVKCEITCEDMVEFCEITGVGEFWVTDESGTVVLTNVAGGTGFKFENKGQTAPYLCLLTDQDAVVTAPPANRTLDNKVFKYVGVPRKDQPGILQIGCPSKLYGESTAEGFSVVASQIKALSQQSREITSEMEDLIKKMDNMTIKAEKQLTIIDRKI